MDTQTPAAAPDPLADAAATSVFTDDAASGEDDAQDATPPNPHAPAVAGDAESLHAEQEVTETRGDSAAQ